jgi:hypothetical protein
MKNFFDKMKEGAAEAAKMAQHTVEVTKLKAQIYAKEKEMDGIFLAIGRQVYTALENHELTLEESYIRSACGEIRKIKEEIQVLERKILEIKNEKECVCGKTVPASARHCPFCGTPFDDPHPVDAIIIPEESSPQPEDEEQAAPVHDHLEPASDTNHPGASHPEANQPDTNPPGTNPPGTNPPGTNPPNGNGGSHSDRETAKETGDSGSGSSTMGGA